MKESVLKTKSYDFALRAIKLQQYLAAEQKEFVLSKQVLRSGTSIGANVEEAGQAQSKSDFIHKLSIAQKEAFETHYWIRLLRDSRMLTASQADSLLADCEELQKMITASIKTVKRNLST
jgi:four helix bundle protein